MQYIGYLAVDTIFQLVYMFTTVRSYGPIGIVLSLFFVLVEVLLCACEILLLTYDIGISDILHFPIFQIAT